MLTYKHAQYMSATSIRLYFLYSLVLLYVSSYPKQNEKGKADFSNNSKGLSFRGFGFF